MSSLKKWHAELGWPTTPTDIRPAKGREWGDGTTRFRLMPDGTVQYHWTGGDIAHNNSCAQFYGSKVGFRDIKRHVELGNWVAVPPLPTQRPKCPEHIVVTLGWAP